MSSLVVLFLASSLLLSQPGPQPTTQQTGQQSSGQTSTQTGQPVSATGWGDEIALSALGLMWATAAIQFFVFPFYNKGESLHKDYWASGRINSTIAALEAGSLIPALAEMFNLATQEQEDKRRRPESEIEELLQRVDFHPFLESAQGAMTSIVAIKEQYRWLKQQASRLWQIGLGHVFATLCLPATHVFLVPIHARFQWLFWSVGVGWLFTLAVSILGFIRFHSHIVQFNDLLEISPAEEI